MCVCVCRQQPVTMIPVVSKQSLMQMMCASKEQRPVSSTHTHTHTSSPEDGWPRVWVVQTTAIQRLHTSEDLSQDDL